MGSSNFIKVIRVNFLCLGSDVSWPLGYTQLLEHKLKSTHQFWQIQKYNNLWNAIKCNGKKLLLYNCCCSKHKKINIDW